MTARTAWYVEGNSKATPPPHSIALGQAKRAGRERRDGRRCQGSKPHGRDSERGAGQRPRARRRNAGTHVLVSLNRPLKLHSTPNSYAIASATIDD
ncbi:hypothetical protein ETQ85_24020 [Zoogloea oleivorans]|uniref:Uncharacterized protein n=1 Tax=Zoogloea oleivorans TaxID=1552750 RepID=A0A6C2CEA6_9RHOO|nr:hypothetical protein ETQ85_24020 [Zoogloea oleivorans]